MKMSLISTVTLLFLINFGVTSDGAKILSIFNIASKSHYILGSVYLKALAEAGHEVTMVSPFNDAPKPKNSSYREIVLDGLIEHHEGMINFMNDLNNQSLIRKLWNIPNIMKMIPESTELTLSHTKMQKLIHSGEKFDVLVLVHVPNDALKLLGPHFGAHIVLFSTFGPSSHLNNVVGNPTPLSYIPEMMTDFSPQMTFLQRITNVCLNIFGISTLYFYHLSENERMAKQYIPNTAPFYETINNISLVLLNSHESLHDPAPYVPVMKNIGGFHVAEPKTLPKDLQEYMDNSKNGVIYFSMGSNLKSANFSSKIKNAFLKSFAKLKQNVLWKFENENLTDIPTNVKISKWLPQQDILAHPNVKLFITHGGLLSTIETIYHGVPIIAIPIFGDQIGNAERAKRSGYALTIPLNDITEDNFSELLQEILTNQKYKENVKTLSKIMKDREVKPIDSAVYWTEYIIRYNGAPHLKVEALNLPWYKYFLIDVLGTLFTIILCLLYVSKKLFCCIINLLRKNKNRKEKVKRN